MKLRGINPSGRLHWLVCGTTTTSALVLLHGNASTPVLGIWKTPNQPSGSTENPGTKSTVLRISNEDSCMTYLVDSSTEVSISLKECQKNWGKSTHGEGEAENCDKTTLHSGSITHCRPVCQMGHMHCIEYSFIIDSLWLIYWSIWVCVLITKATLHWSFHHN